jgi:hypothetical protein
LNPDKIFPSKKGCGEIHIRPLPVHGTAPQPTNAPGVPAA